MLVCLDISRSVAPLHSLALPSTFPTLEFLAAIITLFPDLKELSIEVAGFKPFRGPGYYASYQPVDTATAVGTRSVALRDDTAFENLPENDISDAEATAELPPVVFTRESLTAEMPSSTGIHQVLRWIFSDRLALPVGIEVFWLMAPGYVRDCLLPRQQQAVAALSLLWPFLRDLQFGLPDNTWRRKGDVWTLERNKSCVRVRRD
ncbi:hypothetical protein B0H17DRAFT_376166 [Mycena rosella]|uniref:Uncharacterized protein n=1 Tax=Mycena rosella TaxID=1033263 RepID=A0AAD7DT91_MYCRO|nr:hypothetical protein B0H17DRAFT_376166 [Mycena rosella]